MSQERSTSLINIPDIPEPVVNAMVDTFNDTTSPARKNIGITLGNLTDFAFGGFNHYMNKKRIHRNAELDYYEKQQALEYQNKFVQYSSEITDAIDSVPEEKLVEPRIDIVGPAIEASKYYINNDDIRRLFVNLIGASINSDTSQQVHHSFVEVIKQLSPLDASNLKVLSRSSQFPLSSYKVVLNDKGDYRILKPLIWLYSDCNDSINDNAISLTNLVRLGLAEIPADAFSVSTDYDALFKEQSSFKHYSELIDKVNAGETPEYLPASEIDILKGGKYLAINKHIIRLTPFGKAFTNICCY